MVVILDSTLWVEFFGNTNSIPEDASDFVKLLNDGERETMMHTYYQRLELVENNPQARSYIAEIAKKELFLML